jgi:NADPH:quinone reductase-like Zn-dependent oxidoreductase
MRVSRDLQGRLVNVAKVRLYHRVLVYGATGSVSSITVLLAKARRRLLEK